jgi:hypothetical protein
MVQVDPVSGRCRTLFSIPEPFDAVTVLSDGSLIGQSSASLHGARQIYRLTSNGSILSKVPLSGANPFWGFQYSRRYDRVYGPTIAGTTMFVGTSLMHYWRRKSNRR